MTRQGVLLVFLLATVLAVLASPAPSSTVQPAQSISLAKLYANFVRSEYPGLHYRVLRKQAAIYEGVEYAGSLDDWKRTDNDTKEQLFSRVLRWLAANRYRIDEARQSGRLPIVLRNSDQRLVAELNGEIYDVA